MLYSSTVLVNIGSLNYESNPGFHYSSDGQGIAIKLSSQITKVTESLQKCLGTINALGGEEITFDVAKDPKSGLYCNETPPMHENDNVPLATKKQLIGLHCLRERCHEEIDLVKVEMIRILTHNFKQIQIIDEYLEALGPSVHESGLRALLFQKKMSIHLEQSQLGKCFDVLSVSPYVFEDFTPYHFLSGSTVECVPNNDESEVDVESENGEAEEDECFDSSDDDDDDDFTL